MISLSSFLTLTHLIGLALAVGAASVKLLLLFRCKADIEFLPAYLKVVKTITRLIVLGFVLLTLSGIGWLLLIGASYFTTRLIVKLVLVAAVWCIGPFIDNVVEPKFKSLAPSPGEPASPEFITVQKRYMAVETIATSAFYVITIFWVLF